MLSVAWRADMVMGVATTVANSQLLVQSYSPSMKLLGSLAKMTNPK